MNDRVVVEINSAGEFVSRTEELITSKGECPMGDRITPLMAYWSLAFEFHRAILSLIENKLYGAAFALVRPLIEAVVRAHLVIFVSDEVLKKIADDEYRTNFGTVGKEIDAFFGTEEFFQNFLESARDALHGYTHVGMHQLGRRFTGTKLMPSYSEEEIIEVIHTATSAAFIANNITTKHLGFEKEWEENTRLFDEWSKTHPAQVGT